ncbi:hypothetical protein C0995_003254 [Termitomyces sp. Mi166|nr:hypothetical protein C0995_003254 [Termitomyces sp. Mi166\
MPANASGSPSAVLAESLAAHSKSAYQALAEVENRARQDVAEANSDAREARLERDKTLQAFHAAQLEVQELQKEVASVKATVSHHKETIVQLRREATRWKDQSRNWQEHFLRVEQERCSLTTKNEELISERLQWTRSLPTPFTPNHPTVETSLSAISPKPRRALMSSRKRPISPPDDGSPSAGINGFKPNRIASKPIQVIRKDPTPAQNFLSRDPSTSTSNQNSNVHSSRIHQSPPLNTTRSLSRTTVVRRVQAMINVKQEESDGESEHLVAEDTMATPNPRHAPSIKRKAIYHDKDCASDEESDRAPSASGQSSEHDDNEELVDNEDDELMLGGETNEDKRGRASKNVSDQYLRTIPSKKRRITVGSGKPPARRKNHC